MPGTGPPGHRRFVDGLKIPYTVCTDVEMQTTGAYRVDNYTDYYLVDRAGKLRIADCRDAPVQDAVKYLLAEPPPKPEHDEPADQASG